MVLRLKYLGNTSVLSWEGPATCCHLGMGFVWSVASATCQHLICGPLVPNMLQAQRRNICSSELMWNPGDPASSAALSSLSNHQHTLPKGHSFRFHGCWLQEISSRRASILPAMSFRCQCWLMWSYPQLSCHLVQQEPKKPPEPPVNGWSLGTHLLQVGFAALAVG